METILGIDLGTTNSAVSIIRDGQPVMLLTSDGEPIVPSVVGLDGEGKLLVGRAARNQALVAPERTVKSIKRKMGEDTKVSMAGQTYTPQEISAMILRSLKAQAERALGYPVSKAVITVPAFFNDTQRSATREAGELAGLEVVRIINEPTAATLVYEPRTDKNERLMVYDLGGGTFDVSIVQIENGVVEVLTSHGDTHLGGDDFDKLLLDMVCERFQKQFQVDLRQIPRANARMLQAVEEAKKRLSTEACVTITEEFIAEHEGRPLHVQMEVARHEYEQLIQPLLDKTVKCVDDALVDAKLNRTQIDKVVLVGGSTRTPLVQTLVEEALERPPHFEVDPDLAVAMGAAVQGAMIAGVDVGPILVDITPHTLGIECLGELNGRLVPYHFSAIIPRNTPLPATRSELYSTCSDGQRAAEIGVMQGENEDARRNQSVGTFMLDGLDENASRGNAILVRFDLNLDGILTVTAVERATSLEKRIRIENSISQFRAKDRNEASARVSSLFSEPLREFEDGVVFNPGPALGSNGGDEDLGDTPKSRASDDLADLIARARRHANSASPEDAEEIKLMLEKLITCASPEDVSEVRSRLEDLLFYLADA